MLRLFSFFLLMQCLLSCGSKTYDIRGLWINSAQFVVTAKDTIWDRRNVIWELDDSLFRVYQINYHNIEMVSAPANWEIKDKKLYFKSPIAEESWDIVHQGADSLVLRLMQGGTLVYWAFVRMEAAPPVPIETAGLKSFFKEQRFDIEGPTIPRVMDYPLQLQFKEDKFFVYNVPQIQNNFLIWGVCSFKDRPLLILNSILSKQLNHLDVVEVSAQTDNMLKGRYFKQGKAYTLTMTKR